MNHNLSKNQKDIVLDFVLGKLEIEEFKKEISSWKSNADNAFAYLTNPSYYGIEFMDYPCKYFAEAKNTDFNNYYIFYRMYLYAFQNIDANIIPTDKYLNKYLKSKKKYDGIEKVISSFIECEIPFAKYKQEVQKFANFQDVLGKFKSYSLTNYDIEYNLNNLEVDTFEDLANYHTYLYNAAIKMGLEIFPSYIYLLLANLTRKHTIAYKFENEIIEKNLNQNIFVNINFEDFSQQQENIEETLNKKIASIVEKYLPNRPKEDANYNLIEKIDWPVNINENKLYNLKEIVKENHDISFKFVDSISGENKIIKIKNESEITENEKKLELNIALKKMKKYVDGEKKEYDFILNYLHQTGCRDDAVEKDYYMIPLILKTRKKHIDCARHRLQLADYCVKILNANKIEASLNEVYMMEYLKDRNKDSLHKIFQDYVEGFVEIEQFVEVVKNNNDFFNLFESEEYSSFYNLIEKNVYKKRMKYILSKNQFNVYDKYFLENFATFFVLINNGEIYTNYKYYNEYKKLNKFGLSYVADSIMFDYIEKFLKEKPEDITKSKDIENYVKGKLKEIYTVEKSTPQWSYGEDWAYDEDNTPLHYVQSKTIEPYTLKKRFIFKNKRTGEVVEVIQSD